MFSFVTMQKENVFSLSSLIRKSGIFLFPMYIILFFFLTSCEKKQKEAFFEKDILWYDHPAKKWEEALPLGNGRLGIMVFGKTSNERIQLNDDSMWPGDDGWDEPEGNEKDLEQIRELLFQGKNAEADKLLVEKFSCKKIVRSHQTIGDLYIDFQHDSISDYRLELDIGRAVVTVIYRSGGALVTEEAFVSHPARAVIIRFASEAKNGLNGKIRLTRPEDDGFPTTTTTTEGSNLLVMRGEVTQRDAVFNSESAPILHGVKFETLLRVKNQGGEVFTEEDYLVLKNVKEAIFYLVSNTSYYFDDYPAENRKNMEAVEKKDFEILKREHIADYRKYYSRVVFWLGGPNPDTLPTDERIQRVKDGALDTGLETLLFQFGRYLLISSSRPGTNPANLQGLWNPYIKAPWNADYHLNINLQMNYWPADVTNLGELNEPLFDYIDKLIENGKQTAQKNFGCRGAFIPHASDLWVPTWLRAPTAYWGASFGAGGWLVRHYWDHFLFTGDTVFLRERAFPAIYEVAQFYSDWLIEDPRDGTLISAPSTSPENRFIGPEGKPVAACLGSAMDQQVIAEVFVIVFFIC